MTNKNLKTISTWLGYLVAAAACVGVGSVTSVVTTLVLSEKLVLNRADWTCTKSQPTPHEFGTLEGATADTAVQLRCVRYERTAR